MALFSPISYIKAKVQTAKTAIGTRRKRQNESRKANKFNLVPISAGPLCYSCGTYHHGRCIEQRLDSVREEQEFRQAEEAEWENANNYHEADTALVDTVLPLRPSGPWNKKLPCGHIVRDKCACYRDK
jgi:hypothetical protein